MNVELVLKVILSKHFGVEPEGVNRETKIDDDLGLDNVQQSELQEKLEKELRITFSPYECDTMQTIGDYVFAIERQL